MTKEPKTAEIKSIEELLKMKLAIPNYQRPYKWTKKNITELLNDIGKAIERNAKISQTENVASPFRYRIGTIILHWNADTEVFDVVDGQQRIVSFFLIRRYLSNEKTTDQFIKLNLQNKETQANLANNFAFIADWFRLRSAEAKSNLLKALSELLEVVVITVKETSEAFQLFDSQNSRGKELDPHDLLKAYHLRAMNGKLFEMQNATTKWESVNPSDIKELFGKYLFPIIKWTDRDKSLPFTIQELDAFKGIQVNSGYTYAERANKSMPTFQITAPFISGNNFFSMVSHYLTLLSYLQKSLAEDCGRFSKLSAILTNNEYLKSVGFKYTKTLFECALLCYYDRFCNLDEQVVKKLFTWAFMLRVDMEYLGFDSINRYATSTCDKNDNFYTNHCPMFSIINRARVHTDVSNLTISVIRNPDQAKNAKWNQLYQQLKELNQLPEKAE